jgi:hypothetical protein
MSKEEMRAFYNLDPPLRDLVALLIHSSQGTGAMYFALRISHQSPILVISFLAPFATNTLANKPKFFMLHPATSFGFERDS